jgi:hypothetical protein
MMSALDKQAFAQAIACADIDAIRGHVSAGGDCENPTLADSNNRGWKPLELAARCAVHIPSKAASQVLQMLVAGAPDCAQGYALIRFSSEEHALPFARELLDAGANVNAKEGGQTALMRAAGNNCPKLVHLLLAQGADISMLHEKYRETALQLGSGAIVQSLLESAARGQLKSPFDFVDQKAMIQELQTWSAGIAQFAAEHTAETFYAVGFDAGRLKANSEEAFAKTLEKYAGGDSSSAKRYQARDPEALKSLRNSVGDWAYRIEPGEAAGTEFELQALQRQPHDNRVPLDVLVDLLRENEDLVFLGLKTSADFRIQSYDHIH